MRVGPFTLRDVHFIHWVGDEETRQHFEHQFHETQVIFWNNSSCFLSISLHVSSTHMGTDQATLSAKCGKLVNEDKRKGISWKTIQLTGLLTTEEMIYALNESV